MEARLSLLKRPKILTAEVEQLSICEDKIYVCSHEGDLYALDALSGKIIWTKNIIKDFDGKRPMWGFSGSPLLVDNKIILETGSSNGSLICLNSLNGDLIWKSGDSEAGYASPILYGEKSDQIVVFNNFGVLIHNIENGEVLKDTVIPQDMELMQPSRL